MRILSLAFIFNIFFVFNAQTEAATCREVLNTSSSQNLAVVPISLTSELGHKLADKLLKNEFMRNFLERVLGIKKFNKKVYLPALEMIRDEYDRVYQEAQANSLYSLEEVTKNQLELRLFIEALYIVMNVSYDIDGSNTSLSLIKEAIPPEGESAIVISNHPYGMIEGLLLSRALLQARPDVKFMSNEMLADLLPPASSMALGVAILDGHSAQRQNSNIVEQATAHVNNGGVFALFPDPLVPIKKPFYSSEDATQDLDFRSGVSRVAFKTKAQIILTKISGGPQNGFWFHFGGTIHIAFKMMSHFRQLLRVRGVQTYNLAFAPGPTSTELIDLANESDQSIDSLSSGQKRTLIRRMTKKLRNYYLSVFPN